MKNNETPTTTTLRVDLYYREKRGVKFDEGYTDWVLALSDATPEEAHGFMCRFDWSRVDWRTIGVVHRQANWPTQPAQVIA